MTCHFIPPYLLQHLATAADDPAAGACGARTLALDARLRAQREFAPRQLVVAAAGDDARVIHTAANTETLPGTVARSVGDPAVGDAAVDEAYDSAGQVWTCSPISSGGGRWTETAPVGHHCPLRGRL